MAEGVTRARWMVLAGLLGVSAASTGCDKLSELSGGGSSNASAPAAAAPALAPVPAWPPARPPVPDAEVVARVNGKPVTRRDVELAVQGIKATMTARGETWQPLSAESVENAQDLQDVLNDLVIGELMAQDALLRGLDRNTEVQDRFWSLFRTFFSQEWSRNQGTQITVTDEQVQALYDDPTNWLLFHKPERIRVRQLVVDSEQRAKDALIKLYEGLPFVEVATQMAAPGRLEAATGTMVDQWVMHAEEKARYAPDDATVRALLSEDLAKAAFAMDKIGGISNYVQGPDGLYHIFQLVARESAQRRQLAEVRDVVRNVLTVQEFNRRITALDESAGKNVEKFPERLVGIAQ